VSDGFLVRALSEKGEPSAARLIGFVGLLIVCPVLLGFALPEDARGGAFEVLAVMYGALYGVMKVSGAFQRGGGSTTTSESASSTTTTAPPSTP
jgi:hypothetical protein